MKDCNFVGHQLRTIERFLSCKATLSSFLKITFLLLLNQLPVHQLLINKLLQISAKIITCSSMSNCQKVPQLSSSVDNKFSTIRMSLIASIIHTSFELSSNKGSHCWLRRIAYKGLLWHRFRNVLRTTERYLSTNVIIKSSKSAHPSVQPRNTAHSGYLPWKYNSFFLFCTNEDCSRI